MSLVKSASIRWFGEKPKFAMAPTILVSPISADVELVTVDFCERWWLVGFGGEHDDHGKKWTENLVYSSNRRPKVGFEVIMDLSAPCDFHGSMNKSTWTGVAVRSKTEDKAHASKKHWWKNLLVRKS